MRNFDDPTTTTQNGESAGGSTSAVENTVPFTNLRTRARGARHVSRARTLEAGDLEPAIQRSVRHLLAVRAEDGHWCDELEGCTILESEYMLLLLSLGRWEEPRVRKMGEHIRRDQQPHGGWAIYPGGPTDVSTSVKAYFVLRLLGDPSDAPHMVQARAAILEEGGLDAVNSFTKLYLAIFGQYDWDRVPAIPPELILMPRWFPLNIYEMSSWSRVMVVPLSVIWAHRPVHRVPVSIRELEGRMDGSSHGLASSELPLKARAWRRFFLAIDRGLGLAERGPKKPLRARAIAEAERWILERMEDSDGIGAIFPPIINSIFALSCLGYGREHPAIQRQLEAMERLEIEEAETMRVQPCKGPVWDTALAVHALLEAEAPDHPEILASLRWLLDREIRQAGDWQVKARFADPGSWCFQYDNIFNPDCDDTAQVLQNLARARFRDPREEERSRAAQERAIGWLLAMQNDDGGWGAFDKNCDLEPFLHVPFADHNAMLDPSTEDVTGRTLSALITAGVEPSHPAIRRGVHFLRERQGSDGTWYGRWGANYIYGTYLALTGLAKAGEDLGERRYQRAGEWLRRHQNEDGGWGESYASYDEPAVKGRGESTACQTAWALLALAALGDRGSEAVRRGLGFLLQGQDERGTWTDEAWTGTGFPRVFYLRYALYDDHFPLAALATFGKLLRDPEGP